MTCTGKTIDINSFIMNIVYAEHESLKMTLTITGFNDHSRVAYFFQGRLITL